MIHIIQDTEKQKIKTINVVRNVFYSERDNEYIVQLMVNGKNARLGSFNDVHKADNFAKEMRKKYYGEYAGGS